MARQHQPERAQREQPKEESGRKVVRPATEESRKLGYIGTRQTRHPDSAYSLETGVDAPTGKQGAE